MSETTKLKNRDVQSILKALNALDGRHEVVKVMQNGKEQSVINVVPYRIGGRTRMLCGKWLAAMKAQGELLSKVHDDLVRQYSTPDSPTAVPADKLDAWQDEWEKVLADSFEVSLAKIPMNDLNDEENQLPISVLGVLDPILA